MEISTSSLDRLRLCALARDEEVVRSKAVKLSQALQDFQSELLARGWSTEESKAATTRIMKAANVMLTRRMNS